MNTELKYLGNMAKALVKISDNLAGIQRKLVDVERSVVNSGKTQKALPSAEAVQGEWVRKYDDKINCYWYECDQCGEYRPRNQFGHEYNSNFCPNCGARMKGGDTE